MKLSNNFTLDELTKSDTATRLGIDNQPTPEQLECLRALAHNILQPVREHFNKSTEVSSGLRGDVLNKKIGGSKTSQHCFGEAADFTVKGVPHHIVAEWIRDNLNFDQLILEFYDEKTQTGWIHCSFKVSGNRKSVLQAVKQKDKNGKMKTVYLNGLDN